MAHRLDWQRDGADWPNRHASGFVDAGGISWHVQQMGTGPVALLLHGTGSATHSWRDLAPMLAHHFNVVAPDLPGHGFSGMPAARGMSLPGMAAGVTALLRALGIAPSIVVGHSAGAAILARMCLDGAIAPRSLVSLNGALLALRGAPGHLFSPIARMLASSSLVPRLFSWRAQDPEAVRRLIRSTGSHLRPDAVAQYERLVRSPGHVQAALAMMANWDLHALERDLPRLPTPLLLVWAANDRTLPRAQPAALQRRLPQARSVELPGLGHIAHEEQPDRVTQVIVQEARAVAVLPA
jgi:magnesium chelatase accessory protein